MGTTVLNFPFYLSLRQRTIDKKKRVKKQRPYQGVANAGGVQLGNKQIV